jgi:hypothetical protein
VPAQQRLRADQEGPPRRAREEAAESAEQQTVAGLEAGSTDLAFEDTELVAKGEDLDLEGGFGLPAEDEEFEQGADDGVEETQEHGVRSWRARSAGAGWPPRSGTIISGEIGRPIVLLERHTLSWRPIRGPRQRGPTLATRTRHQRVTG